MAAVQRPKVVAHSVQVIDHTIHHLGLVCRISVAQDEIVHIEALDREVDVLRNLFAGKERGALVREALQVED